LRLIRTSVNIFTIVISKYIIKWELHEYNLHIYPVICAYFANKCVLSIYIYSFIMKLADAFLWNICIHNLRAESKKKNSVHGVMFAVDVYAKNFLLSELQDSQIEILLDSLTILIWE
jgi:hypothetical protein